MKENRKLLKEVLNDIRHDMTDEEVLNLLADSKVSVSPKAEKINTHWDKEQRTPLQNLPAAGHLFFLSPVFLLSGWL